VSSFDTKFESLLQRLQAKHDDIVKYRGELKWRFLQASAPGAHQADFDDSSWKSGNFPLQIDARRGESWFRCTVTIPEEVAQVGVSGSTAQLSAGIKGTYLPYILDTHLFWPTVKGSSEIYVNSRRVMSADYWTELRLGIPLNESVKPGEKYTVAFHFLPYHESISAPPLNLNYSRVEEVAFEINSFIQELKFLKDLKEDVVQEAVEDFDTDTFEKRPEDVLKEIEEARRVLSKASQIAKGFKVHLVGHAHIDMNWLWPWPDTVSTIRNTFTTMTNLLERNADVHFSQSQALTYRVVEEQFPELFEKIRDNVKDGRWEVTASTWVEGNLSMGGTEALIRQLLYANRYVKEKLGVEVEICWEPDIFDHLSTYPQILRKSGIKYYYFMRSGPGYPLFWWEGPDGSRVLAFTSLYNNIVTPGNVVEICQRLYNMNGSTKSMFVYGVGDHGGGPTSEDMRVAHRIQKNPALPKVTFSSAQDFFKEIERQIDGISLPVVKSEDWMTAHSSGRYTTHGDIKRNNRLCERLLVDAEKLGVASGLYPREDLRKAWRNMLFNQFHDILWGTITHEAKEYPLKLAQEAINIGRNAIKVSVEKTAKNIRFSRPGVPLIVFNTLSWDRRDIARVKVPVDLMPKNPVVVSADGENTLAQVSEDEVLFLADVPSMGYKTYYLTEGGSGAPSLIKEGNLENEYFKVELDKASGGIESMYDKLNERFVFRKVIESTHDKLNERFVVRKGIDSGKPEVSNLLQVLYEIPHDNSAWNIGEISRVENLVRGADIHTVENGPVMATVKVAHKFSNSKITQYVSLYQGLPRLDVRMVIDWMEVSDEKTDAPMLKVSFTPMLKRPEATFEIPFGYIQRPSDGVEVPALRWVDLSDDEYGVSLLNDSKYGFDVAGNTVRMTLVRTSYSPDRRSDEGKHGISYSIYPHKGGWKEAQTFRRGYEVNHPLESIAVTSPSKGSMPETSSFLQVKPENVVVSCVKKAEDSDDIIVRVYDATGEGAEAEVILGFKAEVAAEADLMEKESGQLKVENGRINVSLKPFEIKTIIAKTGDQ